MNIYMNFPPVTPILDKMSGNVVSNATTVLITMLQTSFAAEEVQRRNNNKSGIFYDLRANFSNRITN